MIMARKARKQMTIYGMLHPQADADRLCLLRGQGGRGFICVDDCVRLKESGLATYVQASTESLLLAIMNEGLHEGLITAAQDQALRTNVIKAKIEKQDQTPICKMCDEKDETRNHNTANNFISPNTVA